MPFKFGYLCDLLSSLEAHQTHDPPYLPAKLKDTYCKTVQQWFRSHRARIDASDTDGVALLSSLFPEKRTDRVCGLKEPRIVRILGRCLSLGVSRARELDQWREKGRGDLGDCVERVQRQAEMPAPRKDNEVTVEEVDRAFARIAGKHRFSSPAVRRRANEIEWAASDLDSILTPLLHRLSSRDMKWFTRILLKNFSPLTLPEGLVLRSFHFLLPELLEFQDSFDAVFALLRGPVIGRYPTQPRKQDQAFYRTGAAKVLVPKVGVKVGRVPYLKARSIKHCVQMAGRRRMSLERKYDGEYCQIHIDLAKGKDWVQIFSKSGKDSTSDREGIHDTIKRCLRIGGPSCGFSGKCILEGELVVWSDEEGKIMEFHKIRKHVSRSGSFLGTVMDSQPHHFEHLMLILYDVMLIDNDPVLTKPQRDRRKQLEQLVSPIPGRADLVMRQEVSFSSPDGPKRLQRTFASGITQRWEGFVLKPCDEPYFTMMEHSRDDYAGRWIKLKKDYIQGLGDTADFAVVGAGYDTNTAKAIGIKSLTWTHFHIACLENKEDVLRFDVKPIFKVVDVVNQSIRKEDMETINQQGQFKARPYDKNGNYEEFNILMLPALDQRMEVVFREPYVFEIMGSGFDKLPNTDNFTLRFPRVVKIHWDRTFRDTVSVSEYETMADQARTLPIHATSQEDAAWITKLEKADRGKHGKLAFWEDSQVLLLSPDGPAPSRAQSVSPRRTRVAAPGPLIRVDTLDMLPGESRLQGTGASSNPTSHDSQSTMMSLPTPPASSPEVVLGVHFKTSSVCEASNSSTSSRKRSAEAISGNQQGVVAKRRKPTTTDCYKNALKPNISTTRAFKLPFSEITNPSYHRRASPPVKVMKKAPDVPDYIHSQDHTEQWGTPKADVEPTPDPIPVEQTQPADNNPAPVSSSRTSATTQAAISPARSGTPETTTTPTRHSCSLTNTLILLSPCIFKMPYLTENLLPPHNTTVFTDPLRFVAYSNPHPTDDSAMQRKIVLVESNRPTATAWLIREISRIDTRQDIEFFDWRVLEDLQGMERRGVEEGSAEWSESWRDRFAGRVRWVVEDAEGRGKVEWVCDGQ